MFKRFFRTEEGSVTVFVAVTMTVLLGFAALAVDYGSLTNERSLLQNAADAAALAGVVKKNESEAVAAAKEYVMKNTTGVSEGDVQVSKPSEDTLQVTINKDCPAFFSQVLTGRTTNQVATSATAKHAGEVVAPGCAIWAENKINLDNKAEIDGFIYSNSNNYQYDPDKVTFLNGGGKATGPDIMPDYSYLMDGAVPFERSVDHPDTIDAEQISKLDPNIIYIIDDGKDITIPKNVTLKISLISNGRIIFRGSAAKAEAKVLYSTYDSSVTGKPAIVLNGSNGTLNVLAYAPNGNVTWDGGGTILNGAIIAQNFIQNGAKGSVYYDENVLGNFPKLVPHLIK